MARKQLATLRARCWASAPLSRRYLKLSGAAAGRSCNPAASVGFARMR